jgi:hypothetical protein
LLVLLVLTDVSHQYLFASNVSSSRVEYCWKGIQQLVLMDIGGFHYKKRPLSMNEIILTNSNWKNYLNKAALLDIFRNSYNQILEGTRNGNS